jgi:hypothetical protein
LFQIRDERRQGSIQFLNEQMLIQLTVVVRVPTGSIFGLGGIGFAIGSYRRRKLGAV